MKLTEKIAESREGRDQVLELPEQLVPAVSESNHFSVLGVNKFPFHIHYSELALHLLQSYRGRVIKARPETGTGRQLEEEKESWSCADEGYDPNTVLVSQCQM